VISKKGNPVAGLIFIVLISTFAIFLLVVGFIGNLLGTEFQEKMGITEEINKSFQTTITTSTVTINTLWYILFAGLLLGLIVQAMMAVNYPKVMLPVFLLTLIITVIIAVVLSDAYVEITKQADLASASLFQQGIYFIMTQLPYLAVIVGLLAIIIIFTRDGSVGGTGGIVN
jgi:hypothetical protein